MNSKRETRRKLLKVFFKNKNRTKFISAGIIGIILLTVFGLFYRNYTNTNDEPISSIAVMPFINQSGNREIEYLSDGMTESLINSLSQIPEISVKSRSSVFQFKDKEINPQIIGQKLSVEAVLLSRITERDNQILVSLELVGNGLGDRIWGKQYQRSIKDLVLLQSDITIDVSKELKLKLSSTDEKKLVRIHTANPEHTNTIYAGVSTGINARAKVLKTPSGSLKKPPK